MPQVGPMVDVLLLPRVRSMLVAKYGLDKDANDAAVLRFLSDKIGRELKDEIIQHEREQAASDAGNEAASRAATDLSSL